MSTRYRIYAYSALHNQKQQSMDLTNDTMLENQSYAQQTANNYAERLNRDFFMHSCDWVGSIEAYEHQENEG
jgi:hypothetical protein